MNKIHDDTKGAYKLQNNVSPVFKTGPKHTMYFYCTLVDAMENLVFYLE